MATPEYLIPGSDCNPGSADICYGTCSAPVKQAITPATNVGINGRWFITMNHPGFNSQANNSCGYLDKKAALGAMRRYSRGRDRRQEEVR
jgi:hypothetical protein